MDFFLFNSLITTFGVRLKTCSVLLTQGGILGEALDTHGLSRHHGNDSRVSRLQSLGIILKLLAGTAVDLLLELAELAGDVSSVAVQDGSIALRDLSWVVQDDDLRGGGGAEKTQ